MEVESGYVRLSKGIVLMSSEKELENKISRLIVLYDLASGAFASENVQSLIFHVTNSTVQLIQHDLAILWQIKKKRVRPLAVSGISSLPSGGNHFTDTWKVCVEAIQNPQETQVLTQESFGSTFGQAWNQLASTEEKKRVAWIPLFVQEDDSYIVALWLERWKESPQWDKKDFSLLSLLQYSYESAWKRWETKSFWRRFFRKKNFWLYFWGASILFSFLIHIPLRVVAPCEVSPKSPTIITAPQEGVIEKISIYPGYSVNEGDVLFFYEKQLFIQQWEAAKKQVEIAKSELKRALALSIEDNFSMQKVAILRLEMEREKILLKKAAWHMQQLEVRAPQQGVVIFSNPEEWRGKPVRMGEQVLTIANPEQTQISIKIPEADNITFHNRKVKIFLNIHPERSLSAHLLYVGNESVLDEKGAFSFLAEAEWEREEDVSFGLKGTAILYGKSVPLIYWILRRPIGALRSWFGF